MMCVSSFCEHCKRIISTNKYARFDRCVTQRTQYSRPACRAHTTARPPHKHIQVQIRMARTPPPSVSRTCPSASQHARLTSLAALCKLARSASAGPWSVQHSTPPRRITQALRNEAPPSLLLPAAGRARRHPACAQPRYQWRAFSSMNPATTIRTTMQPVSSAAASVCKRRRQKFHFRGAYGRQGERGARAHTVVCIVAGTSRFVELAVSAVNRRGRAPHPDKWAPAPSQ